ncbi:conserved domain protein [Bacteroides clarus YIT 12056]|uniref:Conserved domain protein n=1 Tax=Bacteroides clarus YIT 12056 TaxID=762984 RepID=A0ABP2KW98_9BACE|nr:conserved domain protein [Bacteroides clarus YIT 12056]
MFTRKVHTWSTVGLGQGYAVYTAGKNLLPTRKKWNGSLAVIEILTSTEKKSDSKIISEQRVYISSLNSCAEPA